MVPILINKCYTVLKEIPMPMKIIHASNHPEFMPFPQWFDQRLVAAELENNTAEVEKMQSAKNSIPNSDQNVVVSHDATIDGDNSSVVVVKNLSINELADPAHSPDQMKFYVDLWTTQFNVITTYEEI